MELYFVAMLIQSISGIRGTIGGVAGNGLTPPDIVRFATGYGAWVLANISSDNSSIPKIAIISCRSLYFCKTS